MDKKIVENVSDILFIGEVMEQNEIFLEIKMKMFDNRVNLNRVIYTDAFLEEIVENKQNYICLPLVCDIDALLLQEEMTHLFDSYFGTFGTTQIGSFKDFEIIDEEDSTKSLIGYARVPKRNVEICNALMYLHEKDMLKFSYEISVRTCKVEQDITTVDVSADNHLIGLAVVSHPACPSAVSLLVAEDQTKGGENMENQTIDPVVLAEEEILEEPIELEETQEVIEEEIVNEPQEEQPVIEEPEVEQPIVEEAQEDNLTKIAELTQIVMDLQDEVTQKDLLISELERYKIQVETAEAEKAQQEKETKIAELREKAESVLDEVEMTEIAEAINTLDEVTVMAKIGNKFIAQAAEKKEQIQTASVFTPSTEYRILDKLTVSNSDGKYFTK